MSLKTKVVCQYCGGSGEINITDPYNPLALIDSDCPCCDGYGFYDTDDQQEDLMSKRLYKVKFNNQRYIIEADNSTQIKAWVNDQIELAIGNATAQHVRLFMEAGKDIITLPLAPTEVTPLSKSMGG